MKLASSCNCYVFNALRSLIRALLLSNILTYFVAAVRSEPGAHPSAAFAEKLRFARARANVVVERSTGFGPPPTSPSDGGVRLFGGSYA